MFKLRFNGAALAFALCTAAMAPAMLPTAAEAATKADIDHNARAALDNLYAHNPTAKVIGSRAKAVLIFPSIVKAGLVFGGSYGEGELLVNGAVENYYNSFSGSWGLQAGVQSYSYAVFLMNDSALVNWNPRVDRADHAMPVVNQVERDHRRDNHQGEQRNQRAPAGPQRAQERG